MSTITLTKQQIELIESDIAKYPESVQSRFKEMIKNGVDHRLAAMLAAQKAPGTKFTDKTFNENRRVVMNKMKPKQLAAYQAMAAKSGISTQGKFYVGGLGRPTDKHAWVSTVDEAKEVCKIKGLSTVDGDGDVSKEGLWSHKSPEMPPPKKKKLADDIVENLLRKSVKDDDRLRASCEKDPQKVKALRAELVEKHSAPQF